MGGATQTELLALLGLCLLSYEARTEAAFDEHPLHTTGLLDSEERRPVCFSIKHWVDGCRERRLTFA